MSNAGIWEESTPYSKLLITVGIVLVSAVTFTLVAALAGMLFFNVSFEDLKTLTTDAGNPAHIPVIKLIQAISSIGTFLVPALMLAHLFSQRSAEYLFLNKGISAVDILLVLTAMFATVPLLNLLLELNGKMALPPFLDWLENWMKSQESAAAEFTKKIVNVDSTGGLVMNVIVIALIPAIGEELLFRGVVQRVLTEWSKSALAGILISAALFSAFHMQFYGFLPRMFLGVLLSYMLLWSGSIWLPIVAHFINNAAAVIMIYMYNKGSIDIDPDKVGAEGDSFSVLVIGTLFLITSLWLLYKKHRTVKTE